MKGILTCLVLFIVGSSTYAQDSKEKVMEKRAREMHRVMCLDDKEQWKKFIQENYTQALIDKPMRAQVDGGPAGGQATQNQPANALEGKVKMFEQLHQDFNKSKIVSVKPAGDKVDMVVQNNGGLSGTFSLRFHKNAPYLIDGLGIEVGN